MASLLWLALILAAERVRAIVFVALFLRARLKVFGDFSLPPKRTSVPTLIFSGQLKTRDSPNAQVEPYPIPILTAPNLSSNTSGACGS
jgi:hypothetical protein